jgi:hypothetical protein
LAGLQVCRLKDSLKNPAGELEAMDEALAAIAEG